MNIKLTLTEITGPRPLNTPNSVTINCDGMFIGNHTDCDTLKLNLKVGDNDKRLLDNSKKVNIEVDGKVREVIQYWSQGSIFDLKKV